MQTITTTRMPSGAYRLSLRFHGLPLTLLVWGGGPGVRGFACWVSGRARWDAGMGAA